MYKYFPHTETDIREMLDTIGVQKIEDLFSEIPDSVIYRKPFHLPSSHSETELRKKIDELAAKNRQLISFRGAGAYDVYTPSVIGALTSRQEFLTAYTPYQPEISQGTLQYIFEFQSMITELTGMDVSNASVYDGATATAESVFMAIAQTKRHKVLLSSTLNPHVAEVVKTYAHFRSAKVEFIEADDYATSIRDFHARLDDDTACVVVQYPNCFGVIESFDEICAKTKENKSLFIMNADPSTLSILKTPGEIGADIVCGDGQTLGIPLSFGGPYVGFIAANEKMLRKMPGRIVGMTEDVDGKRGFVLTLQAREQHIRREKANSNICSNQSLMALHTVIYMSLLGKQGLIEVARRAYDNAHYFREVLLGTKKFRKVSDSPFFKEFVLETDLDIEKLNRTLLERGYLSGLSLKDLGDQYRKQILFCATEMRTKEEMDQFAAIVEE